jgi:hypothetical protein
MKFKSLTLLTLLMGFIVFAEDTDFCADESPAGIQIDRAAQNLVSVARTPVLVNDSIGVRNASVVAEEEAKNLIVRWLSQDQLTEREVEDSNAISEEATQLTDANGRATSNTVSREMAQTITNFTRSSASAILQGLLKVQERFDADKSEICVAVAISKNSKSMVNEVMDWMNFKGTDDANSPTEIKEESASEIELNKTEPPESYNRKRKIP